MSNYIDNIEIKNFKSIRHQKIDGCKRINVFIGYPNVGKSNILEALGLYSLTLQTHKENVLFDQICRVKHTSELFYNQEYRNECKISINNNIFELSIRTDQNSRAISLYLSDNSQAEIEKNMSTFLGDLVKSKKTIHFQDRSINNLEFVRENFTNSKSGLLPSIKKYHYTDNVPVNHVLENALGVPDGKNLLEILQRESDLRKDLSEILKVYNLKLLLDTSAESIMFIKELDENTVLRIPYHQVADTLKRLFFYKAAIASNSETVLLFEEPEAHMFPPYISKFSGDIIHDENKNQYFLTTHSPFVLNDFMEDAREDLSVYVVGYKEGETTIKRLSDKELDEIYQYGVDLFFNLESYLA